ncbi:MAG: MBL fold metallo-hydrolase [Clostridia bacterium]|nr:MBL fold metallo-hydrolase [Clostridia bacterium]
MIQHPCPLRIISLFSGSKGNCTLVRFGDIRILVDAGMSCRAIERALAAIGESPKDIRAVFITHEHSDHTKALPVFLKKYPVPVHLTEPTAKELIRAGFPSDCFAIHTGVFSVTVKDQIAGSEHTDQICIRSFPVPHDSCACVGYRFSFETANGEETEFLPAEYAAIATDMGCVTEEIKNALRGVKALILESNHDENMLMMGSYPYELKRRILSDHGHLSNGSAASFLCELVAQGTKHILLAHLSPENNTPELAYLTVQAALQKQGFVQNQDFALQVARRDSPVTLYDDQGMRDFVPDPTKGTF